MSARRVLLGVLGVALAAGWVLLLLWILRTTVPGDLGLPHLSAAGQFDPADLRRAREFSRVERLIALGGILALLGALWLYARRGAVLARESAAGRIGTGMLLGMLGLGLTWFAQIPFGVAELWWERRHHLARAGYLAYVIQDFLSLGGQFLFACFALLIVMALAGRLGSAWPFVGAPALVGVSALFALASPWLIPDQHPLRDPSLAATARRFAAQEGVGDAEVRVQYVKRQTTAPNAEAVGLGPGRRVILWDTLVDGFPRRQVRVVIGHELGHLAHRHLLKGIGLSALFLIPAAFLIELLTRRRGGLREPAAVPLALLVLALAQTLALPLTTTVSRRFETEADWSALRTTRDPAADRALFRGFTHRAYSDPTSPWWAHALFDDHPTGLTRIELADAWEARRP